VARPKKLPASVTFRFGAAGETLHRYVKDRSRVRIIIGPLGSGKTTTTIQHLLELVVTQKANASGERKSRWVAIRNTYPDLETTTIPDFREVFTDDIGVFKHSNPPRYYMDASLPDGTRVLSEFIFLALDQPEDIKKLRGTQLTGGWMNETKEIPQEAFSMLDSRIGRYPTRTELGDYFHGILGDTNAPDEEHWIAEAYHDTPKGWKVFRQPGGVIEINGQWVVNPLAENVENLPKGYYDAIIQGKRKDWIDVNVANNFGSTRDGKPVHPDFSKDLHVSRLPLEPTPGTKIIVGIDFGRTPAAAIMQQVGRQIRVINELVTENMGALKFGKILKKHLNENYEGFKFEFWGDPAGEQMAQTDDNSPMDMLAVSGIECLPAWTNDWVIRQNALDNLLCTVEEGKPSIVFCPDRCKTLVRGLDSLYQFKRLRVKGRDEFADKPLKNKWSHVCEALHYALMGMGEGDKLIGFHGASEEFESIENAEEFDGWHPSNVGV
jgi:hypothetical protein